MSRNYNRNETVRTNSSHSDQVHYLHNGTIRSKLIVLKPESTFASEANRRTQIHNPDNLHTQRQSNQYPNDNKRENLSSYLVSSEPGPTHGRLPLLVDDGDDDKTEPEQRPRRPRLINCVGPRGFLDTHQHHRFSNIDQHPSKCTRKLCFSLVVAIVSVTFGAVIGAYFGFRILETDTTKVKEFRGAFRVKSGENYTEDLADTVSDSFGIQSRLYKTKLDTIFYNSVLKKAYQGSQILAIDPGERSSRDDVTVRFNIRMDSSKIDADAGDIYLVLMNEIVKTQSTSLNPMIIDEESIEVHERRTKFSSNQISPVSTLLVNRPNLHDDAFKLSTRTETTTEQPPSISFNSNNNILSDKSDDGTLESPTHASSNILESLLSIHADDESKNPTRETPSMSFGRHGPFRSSGEHQEERIPSATIDFNWKNISPPHLSDSPPFVAVDDIEDLETDQQYTNIIYEESNGRSTNVETTTEKLKPIPTTEMTRSLSSVSSPPRILSIIDLGDTVLSSPSTIKESISDQKEKLIVIPIVSQKTRPKISKQEPTTFRPLRVTHRSRTTTKSLENLETTPGINSRSPTTRTPTSAPKSITTISRAAKMRQASLRRRPSSKSTSATIRKIDPPTKPPMTLSLLSLLPILINDRKCVSPGLNLCSTMIKNVSSYSEFKRQFDDIDIELLSDFIKIIMATGCFEHADYFVCQLLQPGCDNGKTIIPCQGFCQEFLEKCGEVLPEEFHTGFSCQIFPDRTKEKCIGAPECVHQIKSKGLGHLACDGIVDCHDMSDETRCNWCSPAQFLCGGRKCVDKTSRCDGKTDCPNGADERNCLALAGSAVEAAHAHPYANIGYVFLNDRGSMGKICADTLLKTVPKDRRKEVLKNVGESACQLLNYKNLSYVDTRDDRDNIGPYFHILNPLSWRVTFLEAPCQTKHVVYAECSNFECGKRPSHTPVKAINYLDINKTVALTDHGDWPWHAALYNSGHHVCDATLISDQWLITSETCFPGLPSDHWYARIGVVRLESSAPFQERRRVIGRLQSPVKGSQITLVQLDSRVSLSDFVRPICLPATGSDQALFTKPGKKCITLGWDYSSIFSERHLRQLVVTIAAQGKCQWKWPVGKPHVICVIEPNLMINNCQGEDQSGGPLLCEANGNWYLAGIVNWKIGCGASKQPRLYDNVAVNSDWIRKTIANHEHEPALSREIVDM